MAENSKTNKLNIFAVGTNTTSVSQIKTLKKKIVEQATAGSPTTNDWSEDIIIGANAFIYTNKGIKLTNTSFKEGGYSLIVGKNHQVADNLTSTILLGSGSTTNVPLGVIAIGQDNAAYSTDNLGGLLPPILIGNGNISQGSQYSLAIGNDNTTKGDNNILIGKNLISQSTNSNQLIYGQFNDPDTTATLIIGDGINNSNRHNVLIANNDAVNIYGKNTLKLGISDSNTEYINISPDIMNFNALHDITIGTSSTASSISLKNPNYTFIQGSAGILKLGDLNTKNQIATTPMWDINNYNVLYTAAGTSTSGLHLTDNRSINITNKLDKGSIMYIKYHLNSYYTDTTKSDMLRVTVDNETVISQDYGFYGGIASGTTGVYRLNEDSYICVFHLNKDINNKIINISIQSQRTIDSHEGSVINSGTWIEEVGVQDNSQKAYIDINTIISNMSDKLLYLLNINK